MSSEKSIAAELLKLSLYSRLLTFFQFTPWIILGMVLVFIVVFYINFDTYESHKQVQETDNAYVYYDRVVIKSKVNGYVESVDFTDFQTMKQGESILRIQDMEKARADKDRAQATLNNLDVEIALQKAMLEQAKAAAKSAAARLELAMRENERVQNLLKGNAVSKREADIAEINFRTAQNNHQESLSGVHVQEQQLLLKVSERSLRTADLSASEAALNQARLNLGYTRITAPKSGRIGTCKINKGDFVTAGTEVASLIMDTAPYIIANYKETQLARIRPGQPVEICVDTFPDTVLRGRVDTISPATGATYSLLPKDNTSGNFTKVVQRVPVKILFEPDQKLVQNIRSGMSVITRIDTGEGDEPAPAPQAEVRKKLPQQKGQPEKQKEIEMMTE